MKKIIIFALLISVLISFAGCGKVAQNVLTIEGENASMNEYNFFYNTQILMAGQMGLNNEEYWNAETDGKKNFELVKESALNQLVELYVVAQKAKQAGLVYDDALLDAANQYKSYFTGSFNNIYSELKIDKEALEKISKLYAINDAYDQKLIEEGTINLGEDVLKDVFSNNYLKAQHILLLTTDESGAPLGEDEKAKVKEEIESILKRAKSGENFTNLANEFSKDPGQQTSPEGYVFTDGEMVLEFEQATKALKPNEISDIVETSYGYHIIKRLPLSIEKDFVSDSGDFEAIIRNRIITEFRQANIENWKKEFNITVNNKVIDKLKF